MDHPAKIAENQQLLAPPHSCRRDLRIAWQSGLAAGLCLGLPAGIMFWLVLLQRVTSSASIANLLSLFQDHVEPEAVVLFLGTVAWGILLGQIVGYRQWGWLAAASTAGVFLGHWWPLMNGKLDLWIQYVAPSLPVRLRFGWVLGGTVLSVMVCTGFALGLVLRNWKACCALAASSSLTSVVATIVAFMILDGMGVRVGTGNLAMPKVTAVGIMVAAIVGGATMGVVFGRFVMTRSRTSGQSGTRIGPS